MYLNYFESYYGEGKYDDSFYRSSLYRIEANRTSYGHFENFDQTDYFRLQPGQGQFELYVTTDPANGFAGGVYNYDFQVKITDGVGNTILTSTIADATTRVVAFTSNSAAETYYVEITNPYYKTFGYAAALKPVGSLPVSPPTAPVTPILYGTEGADSLFGTSASESILGGGGYDSIAAGSGNDTVSGGAGESYLRGDDGDDFLLGGSSFDDINGNAGNDTISTGSGDDYCVGGRDNDYLSGGGDYDLVYGNLGADTCYGDDGNDVVRGGQDNDVVNGGAGNDYVSGDKGADTMTGGAGADVFHTFGDAGIDRVTDFNLGQGDRVQLDPGTHFTLSQSGADTVIDMTGGGHMILVGVQMSTLTPGWIFGS
jgi:Ca2+-binding RTX toxin-like protein